MMEKLAQTMAVGGDDEFQSKVLCFLAWAAFGARACDSVRVDVLIDCGLNVVVTRQPRRWWRTNRCNLGRLPMGSLWSHQS